MKSLGVIETRGLTSAIQAADAACKAASVEIVGYRKIGSGLVSVCFQGEISAVRTAVDHGIAVIANPQLLAGSLVIARPEESVIAKLLSVKSQKGELQTSVEHQEEKPQQTAVFEEKSVTPNIEAKVVSTEKDHTSKEPKVEPRKGKKS